MLAILMVLAAAQVEPTWQNDPLEPWTIGPWRLTCRRDGNFTGWNHVEGCGAKADVGGVRLLVTRTATEAFTVVDVEGCPSDSGLEHLSTEALNKPGPIRIRLVQEALRRSIKAAVDHCGADRALQDLVVRDGDIAAILEGSDGLVDGRLPGS
ncbi:MAG: hypothetical protein J7521_16435 [Caulobacter sp.]|nr:hypothetical protein [Caulobacter sp.]